MRKFKILLPFTLTVLLFTFFIGCEYDAVLPEQAPKDEISFQGHIIPILNEGCNTVGCHSGPNDFSPDLSPERAYFSLWDGSYIDTLAPNNSLLYRWMIGDEGAPMPPTGTDAFYNATVLKWIEEGALNN